jgi:hypothetical protein
LRSPVFFFDGRATKKGGAQGREKKKKRKCEMATIKASNPEMLSASIKASNHETVNAPRRKISKKGTMMPTEGSVRDGGGARMVVRGLSDLVLRTIEHAATDAAAGAEGGAEATEADRAAGAAEADRAAGAAETKRAAEAAEDSAATEADGPAARGSARARREASAYGGAGNDRKPTQSERDMLGALKADVEKRASTKYQEFNPILVRTSVAAGTNYTFTVHVMGRSGASKLEVTVFEPLPDSNAAPRVTNVRPLSHAGADKAADKPADAPGAAPVYVEVDAGSLEPRSSRTFMERWAELIGIPPVWAYENADSPPFVDDNEERTTKVKFRYTGDANAEAAAKAKAALEERSDRGEFRKPLSPRSLFPLFPAAG